MWLNQFAAAAAVAAAAAACMQVGSKAMSGAANNHIVLAQADSAVAYAQAERA
jgi:hypothetical protein